jgi:hypothetical protein
MARPVEHLSASDSPVLRSGRLIDASALAYDVAGGIVAALSQGCRGASSVRHEAPA